MEVIEKDLVRWRRGKWIAVIAFVFLLQLGLLIWGSQKQLRVREIYPAEPKMTFAPPMRAFDPEWLELHNPFLFAAASWNGFSGEAWLEQPRWEIPGPTMRSRPAYLALAEAREMNPRQDGRREFALVDGRRNAAVFPKLEVPETQADYRSELSLSGFGGRRLAAPLPLPVQYHGDVLASTVVEAMIDRDGLVITARVIENSGSARADADALVLAKRARFTPSRLGKNVPEVGKLIFEWFALNLGDTNNVKR